ncbi:hypothetical protein [Mucilaginibacter paludis]|uniref:Uncharacterized protein n=1 Tax=Mucilaginibacter paludis DSM 18603 TaxID=714943 RepID=H1YCL9_9SPHI|nr:hypothetical protein [Mucilaginibacter paludis]EHQ24206.1 hypothetical protein Mucpa_0001 [Mucilaginibacter paludis DSM 18603]
MSWDILIINSNKPVDLEEGEWPNFKSRQSVIDAIQASFPDSDWSDPSWRRLNKHNATIEFNMGDSEDIGNSFMLHVRGRTDIALEIVKMCSQNNWITFDASGNQFLDESNQHQNSFNNWCAYRDQIVSGDAEKKPWWKFW